MPRYLKKDCHQPILKLGALLGYKGLEQGACNGISFAWEMACMTGHEQDFMNRIDYIFDKGECLKDVVSEIAVLQEKVKKQQKLTYSELERLQILSFYETVVLFQSPHDYPDFWGSTFHQENYDEIYEITSSKALQEQNTEQANLVIPIGHSVNIYTQEEIAQYLDQIAETIDSIGVENKPLISLRLASVDHVVGLTYNSATHGWRLMNINSWPPETFVQTQQVAQRIIQGFDHEHINPEFCVFSTDVYTTSTCPELIEKTDGLKQKLKQITLTDKKAESAEIHELTLVAIRSGTAENFQYICDLLIEKKVSFNKPCKKLKEVVPAILAAWYGNVEKLKILTKCNIDFNISDKDGMIPALIGAITGNVEVLKVLAENKVNLGPSKNKDIPSSLFIASQQGNAEAVDYILTQNSSQAPYIRSVDLLNVFASDAKLDAEQEKRLTLFIAQKIAGGYNKNSIPVLPHEIAYIMGHYEIAASLLAQKIIAISQPTVSGFEKLVSDLSQLAQDYVNSGCNDSDEYINDCYEKISEVEAADLLSNSSTTISREAKKFIQEIKKSLLNLKKDLDACKNKPFIVSAFISFMQRCFFCFLERLADIPRTITNRFREHVKVNQDPSLDTLSISSSNGGPIG